MFKVLVIITGLLNHSEATVTLTSNFLYETMEQCKEGMNSEQTVKDIKVYADTLRAIGYTDLSIQEYKCIPEDHAL